MANAVIILILIILIWYAVRRIVKTIMHGGSCCGGGSSSEKKIRVRDRNKANYPYSYELKVEGMVCSGCVRKVENAFNSDGELWARVNLENKTVHVLSKKEMTEDSFRELLKGTSYTLLEMK